MADQMHHFFFYRETLLISYRITAATATNAIDFMRYHRTLCFAMMNNRPEDMAA
jgi:hypothetical protein